MVLLYELLPDLSSGSCHWPRFPAMMRPILAHHEEVEHGHPKAQFS
jgi:hypothetical protein